MSFLDLDIGENLIGKKASQFEVNDFMPYTMEMFKNQFGFRFVPDPLKDRAIYQWLKKTYGPDSGNIVKWVFYRHKGSVNGDNFNVTMFQSAHKWWIDGIFTEMKVATVKKAKPTVKSSSSFMTLEDMLKYAS